MNNVPKDWPKWREGPDSEGYFNDQCDNCETVYTFTPVEYEIILYKETE